MVEYIEKAIDLTKKYNQFKSKNDLIIDIVNVIDNINESQAEATAGAICKVITFWIEAYSKELIDLEFIEFYDNAIQNKEVVRDKDDKYVWCSLELEDWGEKYDITINRIKSFNQFVNYKRDSEFLGIVRIETKGGYHSIIAYRDASGKLKISDTGRRGIDVNLFDYVNEENFKYFTEMEI